MDLRDAVFFILTVFQMLAPHRMSDLGHLHKLLDSSYSSMPQPQDTEKCVSRNDRY